MMEDPANEQQIILPGSTLGVFGGGQLGAMFVAAAQRMGYRTIVFAPEPDSPAGARAHRHIRAPFEDTSAVIEFAKACDAITLEFENVPVAAVEQAANHTRMRPSPATLGIAQNRLTERAFLDRHGLPTALHHPIRSRSDIDPAMSRVGRPCVLKRATTGYDGRGQIRLDRNADPVEAWHALGEVDVLCEQWVEYTCELSVLVARGSDGKVTTFGPIENRHVHHILDLSSVPSQVPDHVSTAAAALARSVAENLDLVGLICVEMFHRADGELLINELAPRPHNSGHLSLEACDVSQFEQQVRALCGLPLSPMTLRSPAAMANLLGDLWEDGEPDWSGVLRRPNVALHLYGKFPRARRKMGHLTATGSTADEARRRALEARDALRVRADADSTAPCMA